MNNWREVLENAKNINNNIAEDLFNKFGTGYLECQTCGYKKELTQEGIAKRLSFGWEKCCGYTMRWITENEIKGE